MKHPLLYHKAKGGDLRQWQVWTEGCEIVTEYGSVGGKLQEARKTATPKNVGRSNETSPEDQAELEAAAMHKHKLERKYSESKEGAAETLALPMLAHPYEKKAKKFVWPGHAQAKLDGVRCIASRRGDGKIMLTSRQGKPWFIPHVQAELAGWLPDEMVLDGELYVHGESCQRVTSWAKSADPNGRSYKPESLALVYHVYDVPTVEGCEILTWEERADELYSHRMTWSDHVDCVPIVPVADEGELWLAHGKFIGDGYEGAILRGLQGQYLWGYRSAELLKVKKFQDAEFRVIDARDGKGKMEGCVVWACENDLTDAAFECTMKVTMDERRRMYEARDQYIGSMLTVRFFDRTDDQIPRFPVGIVFRDAIDLP
jgi:DNA ligase-1